MIAYDNSNQFWIIFQKTGSVIPASVPTAVFTCAIGTTLALLRHMGKIHDIVEDSFSCQTIAVVIGYLLVVRTNMALGRWMDGISEVQTMLSKWADAFDALSGFFAGRAETATREQRERILTFRLRIAHWFSLMSCLAFATLRNQGNLDTLSDVPIKEMFGAGDPRLKKTTSFCTNKSSHTLETDADKSLMSDLDLLVLSSPTIEEVELLEMAHDKVNTICLWIVQGITLEIRAGTLDTPAPIVSRVFQEISNGMLGYSQAHKIATVPFPFPFAQMVSVFLVMLYVALPFYVDQFTKQVVVTPIVSFLLPLCYCGLNKIAIELEEPFGTDDNDVDIEVMHEEFLWLLVDILRQPDISPMCPSFAVESRILNGATQGLDMPGMAPEVLAYKTDKNSDSALPLDSSMPDGDVGIVQADGSMTGSSVGAHGSDAQ